MSEVTDPVDVYEGNTRLIQLFEAKLSTIKEYVTNHQLLEFADLLASRVTPSQQRDLEALRRRYASDEAPTYAAAPITARRSRGISV